MTSDSGARAPWWGPVATHAASPVAGAVAECDILASRLPFTWRWPVGRNGLWVLMVTAAAFCLPSSVTAQMPSLQESQVTDIETMKDKFIGLAQAFDEAQYDWRPMDGVRSVRDVFGLIIAECHVFPTAWGHEPPAEAASGFGPELRRAGSLTRTEIISELDSAFDHLIGIVRGMDETERMTDSDYFGRPMKIHANIMISMGDMHEHLGQLIAYARTNHVVPPWSR